MSVQAEEKVASFLKESIQQACDGKGPIRIFSNTGKSRLFGAMLATAIVSGMAPQLAEAADKGGVVNTARKGSQVAIQATSDTGRILRSYETFDRAKSRGDVATIAAGARLLGSILNNKTFRAGEEAVGNAMSRESEQVHPSRPSEGQVIYEDPYRRGPR